MKSIIYYSKPQRSISVTSQTFPDVVFQSYLWFLEKPVWKSIHIECTEHGLRLASGAVKPGAASTGRRSPWSGRGPVRRLLLGRGLSLTLDTAGQRASGSACLLGLRWHGWREDESQERWATGPTGAGRREPATASHCSHITSG